MSVHSTGLSKYELRELQPRRIDRGPPLDGPPLDPLTVTVAEVHRLTGLGLTTIWKLIAEKELETVHVGRRTLVIFASLRRLLTPNIDDQATEERSSAARRRRAKRRDVKKQRSVAMEASGP